MITKDNLNTFKKISPRVRYMFTYLTQNLSMNNKHKKLHDILEKLENYRHFFDPLLERTGFGYGNSEGANLLEK